MTKHSYFPYAITYSSTRHNTNIHHTPYTIINILQHSKAQKPTIFNNCAIQQTFWWTPTQSLQHKTNVCHIHTSIVSKHLAIRKYCAHFYHTLAALKRFFRLTHSTLAQLRTNKSPFLKLYLHKVDAKLHPSTLCPLCNTHTRHTSSLQLHPHTHHIVTLEFVGRPRGSDCTAGQMDGEAGWWTTSGNIGSPH